MNLQNVVQCYFTFSRSNIDDDDLLDISISEKDIDSLMKGMITDYSYFVYISAYSNNICLVKSLFAFHICR